jgi:UDP:flavonoid glycosyltransferase YjiC (YdhE family)
LRKHELTAERLRDAIRRVATDEVFLAPMSALQSSFALAGGVTRAADLIEHASRVGIRHLVESRPD